MARIALILKSQKTPKFSVRSHNRCKLCGRSKAYLRQFGLCRLCFRENVYKGNIPGVTKASW
ncbi:MAG: 30S ribosomal protein S14p/S29e [uncultured bacterium]|uniref:Small ribosomal subunit protein uS14 n=2 Tax=Candidatus Collieribacteriota TaxID=1752725 RepID=A0A1F5FXG4_9BACT|nr:MAG: 30S ribosomal protein S14p/S29e [uncultured bacterium]KKU21612.1 MAG: 30S ribosomal protein S14 type Z [Microgenomates group bacterium GW2011_GWF1_46_12]KKU26884.1 MAG: 30S ribosomal protein S14 type Z [Microgenomates group bacterium GW2011_GWC1_46_16]KKU28300.1 MAG: 30S ribosomal protein S14 type Z [Microgenomates group bacterium GW2011_GWF2_46_18]KKU44145.1 MAG: 30S ribosomal protein S14 type Z [Microgenomates group bacterium GW2011_GWA1_46_7]KKU45523.1 MAG: 30S ribosomal protein S14